MYATPTLQGLFAAVSIGLLIGAMRERGHADGTVAVAGVRTHTLVAICAAVAAGFGTTVLTGMVLVVGALALGSYLRSHKEDPGLTGEVALLVTTLLAALAQHEPSYAAGLGVVVAALLFAKKPLQHFARKIVSEQEVQDALLLAAAALVVLPMLPDQPVDPWGVLVPSKIWRLVVLVMAVGMLGHIALRTVGGRWGLPIAGFFSGFASSTAAVAGFGQRSRDDAHLTGPAASAALLSNLSSLLLLLGVVGAVAPALLMASAWPLAAACLALLAAAAFGLKRQGDRPAPPEEPKARAFRLSHALLLAALIATVLVLSAWLRSLFGDAGALAAAVLVALAEIHAAAATVAQMAAGGGGMDIAHARWGLVGVLAASVLTKAVVAFTSGNRRYAVHVSIGLIAMAASCAAVTLLLR